MSKYPPEWRKGIWVNGIMINLLRGLTDAHIR